MFIFKWVLSFLTGPIIKGLVDSYKSKLAAGNTSERIAADLAMRELEVEKREEELKAAIIVAEQGHWFTRMVRPLWALPFIIWTWKVVVWDKVFAGWTNGITDSLDGQIGVLCTTVAGAYFIGRSAETITRILRTNKDR